MKVKVTDPANCISYITLIEETPKVVVLNVNANHVAKRDLIDGVDYDEDNLEGGFISLKGGGEIKFLDMPFNRYEIYFDTCKYTTIVTILNRTWLEDLMDGGDGCIYWEGGDIPPLPPDNFDSVSK